MPSAKTEHARGGAPVPFDSCTRHPPFARQTQSDYPHASLPNSCPTADSKTAAVVDDCPRHRSKHAESTARKTSMLPAKIMCFARIHLPFLFPTKNTHVTMQEKDTASQIESRSAWYRMPYSPAHFTAALCRASHVGPPPLHTHSQSQNHKMHG